MNTKEHKTMKMRGSADVTYLGRTVDEMIYTFMEHEQISGLTLSIVQAPYIPRVVGYGMSDMGRKRLASCNTVWPAGPISQGYTAVAVMQLCEDGKFAPEDEISKFLADIPEAWKEVQILHLLRHASGISDYRENTEWSAFKSWTPEELITMVAEYPLAFAPGTEVRLSATNFLLLAEIIEKASGMSYHDFIMERQINFLNLKHTGFREDLKTFPHEDISKSENMHNLFKSDGTFIDPTEPAISYDDDGKEIPWVESSALKGFSDLWASAQDISFWDIALAGSILVKLPEHRDLIYKGWDLPDGRRVPASAGWQFYKHRGLMDIKGYSPGFSSFLSRFTHSEELVCVTLLANKEGIEFTDLARRIAGAFGDMLSTNYDDNNLFLMEGALSVEATIENLEKELEKRGIPIFAKFDHAKNATEVGLELRPTTVLVFGSPQVGTFLMQADQSISLELPLKISIWEDEYGSTWLSFPRLFKMTAEYGLDKNPIVGKMQKLMESLVCKAANVY